MGLQTSGVRSTISVILAMVVVSGSAIAAGLPAPTVSPAGGAAVEAKPSGGTILLPGKAADSAAVERGIRAQRVQRESLEQWTTRSHQWQTEQGTTKVEVFSRPAFRRTDQGWEPLSPEVLDSGQGLEAPNSLRPLRFGAAGEDLVSFDIGDAEIKLRSVGAVGMAERFKAGVRVPNAAPKTDLEVKPRTDGFSVSAILQSPEASPTLSFELLDPDHVLGTPTQRPDGSVLFSAELADSTQLEIGAPFAYDADGTVGGTDAVTMDVTETAQGYRITKQVAQEWLQGARFPVTVDPSVTFVPSVTGGYDADGWILNNDCPNIFAKDFGYATLRRDHELRVGDTIAPNGVTATARSFMYLNVNAFVPPGTPIVSAQLKLSWRGSTGREQGPHDVQLAEYTREWQTASNGCNLWWYAGRANQGEYTTNAASQAGSFEVSTLVQRWVNDPESNRGVVLLPLFYSSRFGDTYSSSQTSTPQSLTVEYAGSTLPTLALPTSQLQGMACVCDAVSPNALRADPVNTATGRLVEEAVDASVSGSRLQMRRAYDSGSREDGPLGPGWSHSYASRLVVDSATGDATALLGTGTRVRYARQPDGALLPPPGAVAALKATTDGYRLDSPNGRALHFTTAGRLERITTAADGESMQLSYSGGLLATVTDRAGNQITFTHDPVTGRVASVAMPGYGTVTYSYGTDGRLAGVRRADGSTATYTYDADGQLLTMGSGSGSGSVTNTYGTDGRLNQQVDAQGNTTTFAWDEATQTATTTYPRGGRSVDTYYGNILVQSKDPLGRITRYEYDGNGQPAKVTDPSGKVTTMAYDAAGRLIERIGPSPEHWREAWAYDTFHRLTAYTDADGHTSTYTYTTDGLLASATDALGRTTTYSYDADRRLTGSVGPKGNAAGANPDQHRTRFAYDSRGFLRTLTNPLGQTVTTVLDAQGRLLERVDPVGNKTTLSYNPAGQMLSVTTPKGLLPGADAAAHSSRYSYDAEGNVTQETDPLGRVTIREYDALKRVTRVTDAAGRITEMLYDADGNLGSVTDPTGAVTTFAYDLAGQRVRMVSPRGNALPATADRSAYTWTYGYDPAGNLTSVNNPLTGTTTTVFDGYHRPTAQWKVKDLENGIKVGTFAEYDGRGNVVAEVNPSGRTTYAYDAGGQLVTAVEARGNVAGANAATYATTYTYDADGNLLTSTTPAGSVTSYAYDPGNRLVATVEARGNAPGAAAADYTTTYRYDAAGRLTGTTTPSGATTTYGYDADGNQTTVVDPRGNLPTADPTPYTTRSTFDPAGQLTRLDGPAGMSLQHTYDPVGNILATTNGNGRTTAYTYDPANRISTRTSPTGQLWRHSYDIGGNLTALETPLGTATPAAGDGTIAYQYDPIDRQTGVDYSDSTPDVTFTYWPDGPRRTMNDSAGLNHTYEYDWAGRLATDTDVATGVTSRGTYGPSGLLTQMQTSGGVASVGNATDLGYDASGRLTSVTTDAPSATTRASYAITYDAADRLASISAPTANGHVESRTYDRDGRLTAIANRRGSTTLSSFTQSHDVASNPVAGQIVSGGTTTPVSHQYDAASRLTKTCWTSTCTPSTAYAAYTYDNVGNRTSETRVGIASPGTTTYTYNASDQLTSTRLGTSTTPYAHDANGNQVTAGARTSTYDLANRLTRTTLGSTATAFAYDGAGNRATTTVGTTVTKSVWNSFTGTPLLALELDANNALLRRILNPTGTALGLTTSAGHFSYQHDLQGSIANVSGPTGAAAWTYTYEPFGAARTAVQANNKAPINPMRYTGEYLDGTGQYNLRARLYNPLLGQFTSLDPAVGLTGQAYAYANSNPLRYIDPLGLWSCAIPSGIGLDPCMSTEIFGHMLVGAGGAAIGLGVGAYQLAAHPIQSAQAVYNSCAQGFGQRSYSRLDGGLQCVDNLNPMAHVLDQVTEASRLIDAGCVNDAGEIIGAGLFNTYLAATPARGAAGNRASASTGGGGDPALAAAAEAATSSRLGAMRADPERGSIGGQWPTPTASNCTQCAIDIQKLIGGERVVIRPPGGGARLGPSRHDPHGDWRYHEVVVKDGRVYDGFSGRAGMSMDDFRAQFEYGDVLQFGPAR